MLFRAFRHWANLGCSPEEIDQLRPDLALETIRMLRSYCILLFPLFTVMSINRLAFQGDSLARTAPLLSLAAFTLILLVLSGIIISQEWDVSPLFSRAVVFLFLTGIYATAIFYDVVLSPTVPNSLLCLAFFACQVVFDSAPLDNLIITLFAFIATVYISRRMVPAEVLAVDYFNTGAAVLCGLYISWNKSMAKFRLLIHNNAETRLEQRDAQVKMMSTQIRPHFVYNMLTTIAALIRRNPDLAYQATINFTEYLRGNIDSMDDKVPIPFTQELKHLETYCALEKLRFQSKISLQYDIETKDFTIPALTVEPLVENAIKHNVGIKEGVLHIVVSTHEKPDFYEITVQDDGLGYVLGAEKQDGREHVGIRNVRRRLELMSNAECEVDSTPGQGTTVTIRLPKKEMNI